MYLIIVSLRWFFLAFISLVISSSPAYAQNQNGDPLAIMVETARISYQEARAHLQSGQGSSEDVYQWSVRLMNAERQMRPAATTTALRTHLDRMNELVELVRRGVESGAFSQGQAQACNYYLAEARSWVAQGAPAVRAL